MGAPGLRCRARRLPGPRRPFAAPTGARARAGTKAAARAAVAAAHVAPAAAGLALCALAPHAPVPPGAAAPLQALLQRPPDGWRAAVAPAAAEAAALGLLALAAECEAGAYAPTPSAAAALLTSGAAPPVALAALAWCAPTPRAGRCEAEPTAGPVAVRTLRHGAPGPPCGAHCRPTAGTPWRRRPRRAARRSCAR